MEETTQDDTTRQPSLPIGPVEDPDGQVELLDPGPRAEAAGDEPHPPRSDRRQLPLPWAPGAETDAGRWRRHGADGGRPDLTATQLVLALDGVRKYAGTVRAWTGTDTATVREVRARCWIVEDLERLHDVRCPRWLEKVLDDTQAELGRRVSLRRYGPFLGCVVAAYRAGAWGVSLSLEEMAAQFTGSRSSAVRWVRELVAMGLLVRSSTFCHDNGSSRREQRHNVYQLGPRILAAAGAALLDGVSEAVRGPVFARTARRTARAAQARARAHRRRRKVSTWTAQESRRTTAEPRRRSRVAPRPAAAKRPARPDRRPQADAGGRSDAGGKQGSTKVPPQPPLRDGRQSPGPRGESATPPENDPASLAASRPPAGEPPDCSDTTASPDAGDAHRGGPGGGASDVPFAGVDLAGIAPRLAAGMPARDRAMWGVPVGEQCRGCQGRGSVPTPSGLTRRECAHCHGTGDEPAPPDPRPDPPGQRRMFDG